MPKVFGSQAEMELLTRGRGQAWRDAIAPALTPAEGGYWIDRDHPAVAHARRLHVSSGAAATHPLPASAPTRAAPPRRQPAGDWGRLHQAVMTADLTTEGWLDAFESTLDNSANHFHRRDQFAAMRQRSALPPNPSRAVAAHWCYQRHREAPHRSGQPSPRYDQLAPIYGWLKLIVPDRVVCLSLDSRPDRWEQFTASCQTSALLREWKIERFRATLPGEMIIPDWWNYERSHYATRVDHLRMIEQSYVAGHETILIFEDDAIVQPCFDDAYASACAALPDDWMGLWLTSDGHTIPPADAGAALFKSQKQYFLHAYLLNRDGMYRCHCDITKNPADVIDEVTGRGMQKYGRFYSTRQNAVIQIGDRSRSEPRTEFFNRQPKNVIIPPFHGEFGWQLVRHVRYVHELQADAKVVCCRRGEECLYPTAAGFEYEWTEAGPDASRCGNGPAGVAPTRAGYVPATIAYAPDGPWKKFTPTTRQSLPVVDVVLGVRRRDFEPDRNWPHWRWLAEQLRAAGLRVGIAGRPDTSDEVPADARAWDHPDGPTAGSVDLLTHCRVYVGTDSGISHLAALCDARAVLFRCPQTHSPDMTGLMAQMNRVECTRLPDTAWADRDEVLAAVLLRCNAGVA